jgi:hypothetical protein
VWACQPEIDLLGDGSQDGLRLHRGEARSDAALCPPPKPTILTVSIFSSGYRFRQNSRNEFIPKIAHSVKTIPGNRMRLGSPSIETGSPGRFATDVTWSLTAASDRTRPWLRPITQGLTCYLDSTRLRCDQLHLDSGVGPERFDAHRLYHNHGLAIYSHHFARGL